MIIALILILLIASLIELLYGSRVLGLLFLLSLIIVLSKFKGEKRIERKYKIVGLLIVAFVIIYNKNGLGVLDVMLMLMGISLALSGSVIAYFTFVMSSFFVVSFILLYSLPHALGIPLPYYYGHYLVALPVVEILRRLGYDVCLSSMRTITVNGIQPVNLIIELSCFGWYSLLIALGAILAYSKTMNVRNVSKLILATAFAVYLANLLRIAILVVVAYDFGIEKMLLIHAHIGWILFASIVVPLLYILNNSRS